MKKQQALDKLKTLESEIEKLREIINQPEDLFSKIKTYSDVCKELNEEELTEYHFSFIKNKSQRLQTLAFNKLKQIQRLFNGDWEAIFNESQYNYYPYFTSGSGGLVFNDSDFSYHINSGKIAFFKTREISDFVGKTFVDIYREIK